MRAVVRASPIAARSDHGSDRCSTQRFVLHRFPAESFPAESRLSQDALQQNHWILYDDAQTSHNEARDTAHSPIRTSG